MNFGIRNHYFAHRRFDFVFLTLYVYVSRTEIVAVYNAVFVNRSHGVVVAPINEIFVRSKHRKDVYFKLICRYGIVRFYKSKRLLGVHDFYVFHVNMVSRADDNRAYRQDKQNNKR